MSEAQRDGEANTENNKQSGGADINSAAAAARREERAKRQAVEQERDELRSRLEALEKKDSRPRITEEDLEDPARLDAIIEARLQAEREAMKREQEERLNRQKAEENYRQTAERIRGKFKIFSDDDYGADAKALLSGYMAEEPPNSVTEERYEELCQRAAKRAERMKANDTNQQVADSNNGEGVDPPPPGGGAGGAMSIGKSPYAEIKGDPKATKRSILETVQRKFGGK